MTRPTHTLTVEPHVFLFLGTDTLTLHLVYCWVDGLVFCILNWFFGWFVGSLVGSLIGLLIGWLVASLVGPMVGFLLVLWLIRWLAYELIGYYIS